jgi:hypothetical protein
MTTTNMSTRHRDKHARHRRQARISLPGDYVHDVVWSHGWLVVPWKSGWIGWFKNYGFRRTHTMTVRDGERVPSFHNCSATRLY